MSEALNPESWAKATATRTLTMTEMDALIVENQKLWTDYEEKKKISSEAFHKAEESDAKICQALKDAGKTSFKVDGLGTITIVQTESVTTPKSNEDKKKFFKYLRETAGDEVMFTYMTVNSQSLNSWYKKKVEEVANAGNLLGFQVPGIDAPTMKESLRFNQDRKKGKK